MTWCEKFIIAFGVIKSSRPKNFGKSFGKFLPVFFQKFSKKFHNCGGVLYWSAPAKVPKIFWKKFSIFFQIFSKMVTALAFMLSMWLARSPGQIVWKNLEKMCFMSGEVTEVVWATPVCYICSKKRSDTA